MKKAILGLMGLTWILACSPEVEQSSSLSNFEKIVTNPREGHFRSFSIGDSIEIILNNETAKLIDSASDYLYYDENLSETDYFNVSYHFDETGLFEIMLDVNFENQANADTLYGELHNYFSLQNGPPTPIDSYDVWKLNSDVSKKIEIALSMDVTEDAEGHILLTITNYDY